MLVNDQHIFYEVNLCVTLIQYDHPSNSFQDYKAKSLDHEIQVTDQYIFYMVNLCVTLIH